MKSTKCKLKSILFFLILCIFSYSNMAHSIEGEGEIKSLLISSKDCVKNWMQYELFPLSQEISVAPVAERYSSSVNSNPLPNQNVDLLESGIDYQSINTAFSSNPLHHQNVVENEATDAVQASDQSKVNIDKKASIVTLDNALTVIEALSGMARGAVFGILAYDLGDRASLPEGASILFGIGAGSPMAMLGYGNIQRLIVDVTTLIYGEGDIIKKLKSSREKNQEDRAPIFFVKEKCGQYLFKSFAFTAGLISAPPLAYLSYEKFSPYMGAGAYIFAVPTFYVRTMVDYFMVQAIVGEFYPYIERPFLSFCSKIKQLRHKVQEKINLAYFQIEMFTNTEADQLISTLSNPNTFPENKVYSLLHPRKSILGGRQENRDKDRYVHNAALLTKFVGQIIGIGGMLVYYPIARNSFIPILEVFGFEPTEENLSILGTISTATLSSLTGYATGNTFKNIFLSINRFSTNQQTLETKRYISPVLGALIAPWNAIMQTELGFEFLNMSSPLSYLQITASSIAALATCYWIVDSFFNKYVFKNFDSRSTLLNKLNTISKRTPQMSFEKLEALDALIENNN